MDDIERKAALDAMFKIISPKMLLLLNHWDDMGEVITEGQENEINHEIARLQDTAGRAAILAKECIVEARNRMALSCANDTANEQGFMLISKEDLSDDDGSNEEEKSNE